MRCVFLLFILLCSCSTSPANYELIICGGKEVFIIDTSSKENKKIWSWRAAECPDLPESYKKSFNTTADCKSVDNGTKILIVSSGSGVALVRRNDKKLLFYSRVKNAHSAELLPGGIIAVAGSVGEDRLVLFDAKESEKEIHSSPLPKGHGVVWDSERKLLYALAYENIHIFNVLEKKLKLIKKVKLPEGGGHELLPVPGTDNMALSTNTKCWLFNRENLMVTPHPVIHDTAKVKCISSHTGTGQTVYVKAAKGKWWTDTLHFFNKESIQLKSEIIYKARWVE